ncbi:hypothetical protein [Flavobacterium crassostreae]|uniref:Glycosyltransferase n=1 Tax=Flavobacterium crassostreae TaxID=1763534 RepID=A0A1B9E3M7_9FLAO|nr:hypothetical protein [Flavobacterium crassostreae]OCB76539.1 hypothetical protein LPBF_06290 [Flavobacterium crassostreae]
MLITILNIPNYCSSYYLYGLSQEYTIHYVLDTRFKKYNNTPLLIFRVNDKIAVIDNRDPMGVIQELYEQSSVYFVTNKHKELESYKQINVKPLFPHYPINILPLYTRLFGLNLFRFFKPKELAREVYTQFRRPSFRNHKYSDTKDTFVFFSANIWKKEPVTNEIRAAFIKYCKQDIRLHFKGGFVPRSDGNNYGYDAVVNTEKYSAKTFSRLSSKSLIGFNNPAVCDAVSWRLAEYLNFGVFVLSFPFKIDFPINLHPMHNIHVVSSTQEYETVVNKILEQKTYHDTIARNGKKYFDEFCTPRAQAKYIVELICSQCNF